MSEVNVELGNSSTDLISLNDTAVRNLASIPTGTISMDDLRGKSSFGVVGGTPYSVGENEYNVFTSTGPLTVSGGPLTLEYLMIGGGGGAGAARGGGGTAPYDPGTGHGALPQWTGGGGGAGAYRRGIIEVPGNMSTTVTVGAGGGPGSTTPTTATNGGEGGDSSFTAPPDIGGFTVYAGGGGGGASVTIPGASEYGDAYGPYPAATARPRSNGSGGGGCGFPPGPGVPSRANVSVLQSSIENGLSGGNYYGNALPGGTRGGGGAITRGHETYDPSPPSPIETTGAPDECGGGGIQIPAIFADDIGPVVGEPQHYVTFVYAGGAINTPRSNMIGGGGGGGYPVDLIDNPTTPAGVPGLPPGGPHEPCSVGGVEQWFAPMNSDIPTGGGWCGAAGGFRTGIFTPNQNAIDNTGSGGGGNAGVREDGTATPSPTGPIIPYISSACDGGSGGSGIVIFRHMSASNPSDPATVPGIGIGTTAGVYPPATPVTSPTTIRTTDLVCWLNSSNLSSYKGSGSTWEDLSGNSNDGTINGDLYFGNLYRDDGYNPTPVEELSPLGDFGGGFDFTEEVPPSGPAKYINMGSTLGRTLKGTIGFYINTNGPRGNLGWKEGTRYWGVNPNFELGLNPSNPAYAIDVNLGGNVTTLPVTQPNTHQNGIYVVVTWDQPAGTCNLYAGIPVVGQTAGAPNFSSVPGICGSITPQTGDFWFGGTPSQPVTNNFRGILYQAHVYDEVLPAPNIYDNLTALNINRTLFDRTDQ